MTAAQQHSLWHLVLNRSHWKRTQVSHAALSLKQIQIHKLQLYEVIRNETTKYALYEVIHTLVPISNVSTAWKAPDPFGNLQLPPAASTSSDMPPPPPPAGSRSYSRYRHTFAATQGFARSASLSEAQRDRARSSPCLPPPPAPLAPGSSAVTFDPHRRGVSSVPSRGRAISVPPSPPSTAPGSPPSTAASKRKYDHAPWNDPRVPVTPAASATPADPPPWQSLKRPRSDGSVRTARTVSPQPRPDWWGQRVNG